MDIIFQLLGWLVFFFAVLFVLACSLVIYALTAPKPKPFVIMPVTLKPTGIKKPAPVVTDVEHVIVNVRYPINN